MSETQAIRLTPEQTRRAREILQAINRMLPTIDDLEACGIECAQRRANLESLRSDLENMVNRFGSDEWTGQQTQSASGTWTTTKGT